MQRIGEENTRWYRLDNAAILYPSIESSRITTMFRFAMEIDEDVREDILQKAVSMVIERFPYYRVKLSRGLFWYYLEYNSKVPKVEKDVLYPCGKLHHLWNRFFLFRVRYYKTRIAVEFCHALTDGTGAITFLKSIVYEYLKLTGRKVENPEDVFTMGEEPKPEEFEDAYNRFYKPDLPLPEKGESAFHLAGKLEMKGVYNVITGIIPLKELLLEVKKRNVTITVFLTAIYMDSLQIIQDRYVKRNSRKKPIAVSVPVNMRKVYKSATMRNFSLFVIPKIDPRLGRYSFDEILKIVQHTLTMETNEKSISRQLSRNVGGQRNIFIRVIPLFIKKFFGPVLYRKLGEDIYSGGLSNLGRVKLPEEMEKYVSRIEFIPAPGPINKTGCSVVGYKDSLYISFGRVIRETELEKEFFRTLIRMKIPVKIESNV